MAQNSGCLRPLLIGIIVLTSFSIAAWYLLFATNLYEPPESTEKAIFFENAWIWDGEIDSMILGNVLVEGAEISCVGSGCVPPSGSLKIDATGKTLMPGLIDLHIHFYAPSLENKGMNAIQQLPDYVKQRPEVRKNLVRSGITSIRCVGDITDNIVQLRRQSIEGEFAGPRVYISGGFITAKAGHPVSTLFAGNQMLIENACFELNSEVDAIAAVSTLKAKGVNGLKVVYTKGPSADLPRLDLALLDVLLEEAEKAGLWVAVHALSEDDLSDLVERSVTSIEHASQAEFDTIMISQMLRNDIALVPTMVHTMPDNPSQLKKLVDKGIIIGTGSDTQGEMQFGQSLLQEIELLHTEGGLTQAEALRAATLNAARILRIDHLVGKVTAGKRADLLLVEGNVLDSLPTQSRIEGVLIDGKIMKWQGNLYE